MWHMWYLQYMSLRILSFCPGPGKSQKLAVMFEDWCGSEEDWGKSKLVLQMRQVNTVGRKGSRKWMCRHEIVDKYKSEVIADEIISQKMSMDETARASVVRDHPDSPMEELRQYLVFDAESEYDQSDTVLESLFSVTDRGGHGRGKKTGKGAGLAQALRRQLRLPVKALIRTRKTKRRKNPRSPSRRRARRARRARKAKSLGKKPRRPRLRKRRTNRSKKRKRERNMNVNSRRRTKKFVKMPRKPRA